MKNPCDIISVVIPSYNHARYVIETIRSVSQQALGAFEVQVIVIDDGSTDGSMELLSSLVDTQEFTFQLVLKRNEGLCRTLNRAVTEHARGNYIAVIASDDMWHPEKLKLQFEHLQRHPNAELCYSNAKTFGVDIKSGKSSKYLFSGRVLDKLTVYNFIPAGTILFTRGLYDRIGGFDETGLRLEDWDFLLRASSETEFCYVDMELLLYRLHEESAIAKMRQKGILFSEKYKVLKKNKKLLNPFLFVCSCCLHYTFDHILRPCVSKFKSL
jgi:alpha-1,3-rhamnosyltransferase